MESAQLSKMWQSPAVARFKEHALACTGTVAHPSLAKLPGSLSEAPAMLLPSLQKGFSISSPSPAPQTALPVDAPQMGVPWDAAMGEYGQGAPAQGTASRQGARRVSLERKYDTSLQNAAGSSPF